MRVRSNDKQYGMQANVDTGRLCNQPLRDTNELCARVKLKSVKFVAEISSSLKDQPKMHYLLKIFEPACDERNHQIKHQFALAHIVYIWIAGIQAHIQNPCDALIYFSYMKCGRH